MIGHGPADDPPREQILDGGQVEPALPGSEVGDVGDPDPIGPFGGEGPVEEVLTHPDARHPNRRFAPALLLQPRQSVLAHQPLDALAADPLAIDQAQLRVIRGDP